MHSNSTNLDYQRRFDNLRERRFDRDLNKAILSDSFLETNYSSALKYLFESMRPIDRKYNEITIDAAERVKLHLEKRYNLHFGRDYEFQGSVMSGTNIKLYSDIDLLTIVEKYSYRPSHLIQTPYTASDPHQDIKLLRRQSELILEDIYDEVDTKGSKSIKVTNKHLRREVDIVFCFWNDTENYLQSLSKSKRGVYLFDFPNDEKIEDFPFMHLEEVNLKGNLTMDGSRKAIRLLKTLKSDSTGEYKNLSSFQITTVVHNIHSSQLMYSHTGMEVQIARAVSYELQQIISDTDYRKSLLSPNQTEAPLADDSCLPDIIRLKSELDNLLLDCGKSVDDILRKGQKIIYS